MSSKLRILLIVLVCFLFLTGCESSSPGRSTTASESETESGSALEGFSQADMKGYPELSYYDKPLCFVDLTVADIARLVEGKETFAFVASFSKCPWCNVVITYINDAALKAGEKIGHLDTRKDPQWTSNLDIDDYDLFVSLFGQYLEDDEQGRPHLYTPHIFFIKDGTVVAQHQGALPEMGSDPHMSLDELLKKKLADIYTDGFAAMRD